MFRITCVSQSSNVLQNHSYRPKRRVTHRRADLKAPLCFRYFVLHVCWLQSTEIFWLDITQTDRLSHVKKANDEPKRIERLDQNEVKKWRGGKHWTTINESQFRLPFQIQLPAISYLISDDDLIFVQRPQLIGRDPKDEARRWKSPGNKRKTNMAHGNGSRGFDRKWFDSP